MTQQEEARVIRQVLAGDADAFEALVVANQTMVYTLALKMTGNPADAMDVSQDAFLKAYTSLGTFRGGSRFSVWLYRLTYNQCLDFLRKQRREPVVSLTVEDGNGASEELDLVSSAPTPEQALERKEQLAAVAAALEQLSEDHRSILLLREISGLSYQEISDLLHLSPGTVKSRIARAREQLAQILVQNGTFSPGSRHTDRKEGV